MSDPGPPWPSCFYYLEIFCGHSFGLTHLNWRPLDQRRIDSRLIMLVKITYDLVASPQPRTSPVRLGYQDICIIFHTFPLLKTSTGSHFPEVNYSLKCPASPHTSSSHLGAVQQCCLPGDPCLSLNTSFCFYLLTILTLFSHLHTHFTPFFKAFVSANPLRNLVYQNPSDIPLGG